MRRSKKKRNRRLIKFPQDRRVFSGTSPLADPHPEWPVRVAETNAYHNEPRNPYQSEDEDATQAFVQKYLELADIATRDSSDAGDPEALSDQVKKGAA